jgi:hypothetical protein
VEFEKVTKGNWRVVDVRNPGPGAFYLDGVLEDVCVGTDIVPFVSGWYSGGRRVIVERIPEDPSPAPLTPGDNNLVTGDKNFVVTAYRPPQAGDLYVVEDEVVEACAPRHTPRLIVEERPDEPVNTVNVAVNIESNFEEFIDKLRRIVEAAED